MSSPESELEALKRENERLRVLAARDEGLLDTLLEQSPHGVIVCDASGKLTLQNRASERIWAGSATAEDVESWGQYRAFHPDGRPYEGSDWSMARCLSSREVVDAEEVYFQRFDGTFGWLLGSCAPLIGPDDELLGAVSVFADITPFKKLEAGNRRRALELHDDVVQEIGVAKMALALDRSEQAETALAEALAAAQKIVGDLLRDAGPEAVAPGRLRRSSEADGA